MLYTFTMQLKFRLILSFLLISFYAIGERNYIKYEKRDDGQIAVYVSDGVYLFRSNNDQIRTCFFPLNSQEYITLTPPKTYASDKYKESDFQPIEEDNEKLVLGTWNTIQIKKRPFSISYYYAKRR